MSSKEEIRGLFTQELRNIPEYQIILNIKQYIINEITRPNIQEAVVYNFETPLTKDQQNNLSLCSIIEFGFALVNISDFNVAIDMKKFLN